MVSTPSLDHPVAALRNHLRQQRSKIFELANSAPPAPGEAKAEHCYLGKAFETVHRAQKTPAILRASISIFARSCAEASKGISLTLKSARSFFAA